MFGLTSASILLLNILYAINTNTLEPMPFKCIFDFNQTITNLIPGYLVVQLNEKDGQTSRQWEQLTRIIENYTEPSTRTALQVADCLLIVRNKSSINEKPTKNSTDPLSTKNKVILEKIKDLIKSKVKSKNLKKKSKLAREDVMRIANLKNSVDKPLYLNIQEKELPEAPKIMTSDQISAETRSKKLKLALSTKNQTPPSIYYRSTKEDKLLKTKNYPKTTKLVTSKKQLEEITTTKLKIKRFVIAEDGTKTPVYYRSTEVDRLLRAKKYPKTTKIVSSKKRTAKILVKSALHSDGTAYRSITDSQETVNSWRKKNVHTESSKQNQPSNLLRKKTDLYSLGSNDVLDNEILTRESMDRKSFNSKNSIEESFNDKNALEESSDVSGNWDSKASTAKKTESQVLWSTDSDNEILPSESFNGDGYYCSKSMANGDLEGKIICSKISNSESFIKMSMKSKINAVK